MTPVETRWFLSAFPFVFIGGWLAVTSFLGVLSGWFALQGRYPVGDEPPLLTLRGKSGSMGLVSMSGILRLSACESGLRIGIWRVFGIFQRPFLVPWPEIRAEPKRVLFVPSTKVHLGAPEIGTLTIDTVSWQRLVAFASGRSAATLDVEPVSRRQFGAGLLLQWAIIAGGAGTFFFLASRSTAGVTMPPAIVCYGFPALAFGVPQLIRWLRFGR